MITLLDQANEILIKKNLTVEDYNKFEKIGKELTDEYEIYSFSIIAEGFELRLPEIASKVGDYSFIKKDE